MSKKVLLLTSLLLIAPLAASEAQAASWTWSSNPPQMETVTTSNGLIASWSTTPSCSGGLKVFARELVGSDWRKPHTMLASCPPKANGLALTKFNQPVLTNDGNKVALVWSATSTTSKGGIYVSSGLAGKTLSRPKMIIKFSKTGIVRPSIGALIKNGRIWVSWQEPSNSVVNSRASFKVRSFSARTGKPLTNNLRIVGKGTKYANSGGKANFSLLPTSTGLLILWKLTDAGGKTSWYAASGGFRLNEKTLLRQLQMQARGAISVTDNMHFRLGDDGRLYRVEEIKPECIFGGNITYILTQWNNSSGKWDEVPGSRPTINCDDLNLFISSLFFDFAVSKDRTFTLATGYPITSSGCQINSEAGSFVCRRFQAPETIASMGLIFNRPIGGSPVQTNLTPPASFNPSSGKSIVWTNPNQGITRIAGRNLVWLAGIEKISAEGALLQSIYQANTNVVR